MSERLTQLFPLWAVAFCVLAYALPDWFASAAPAIVPLLGVVMFGMGMTLTLGDFARVLQAPGLVALGTGLQFILMPLIAWALGRALGLPPLLMVGLVLVGSCPGGTASNVICYLARGDVALSITLTGVSTLLSVVATPLLTWLYVGRMVPVPVLDMLETIALVVIVPVLGGLTVNTLWGRRLAPVKRAFPVISVFAIVVIIAIIVALKRDDLLTLGPLLAAAVVAHNLLGLAGGYWLARAFGVDERRSRTVAIEVGMQNSGLAVALATQYFSAQAALPGALFSVWHNLSGSALAARWARRHDAGGEAGSPSAVPPE